MNTKPVHELLTRVRDFLRSEAHTIQALEQPAHPGQAEEAERLARAADLVGEAVGLLADGGPDLNRIAGFTPAERRELSEAGIRTREELWSRAGADLATALAGLETQTGIARPRLAAVLATAGSAEATRRRASWPARHWFDVALLLGLGAVVFLAARAVPRVAAEAKVHHLVLRHDVPAFTPLRPEHLVPAPGADGDSAFTRADQVAGRVTLVPLRRGTVLRPRHVGGPAEAGSLQGRQVVSLSLAPDRAVSPGARIGLLFSPRGAPAATPTGALVEDALVLSAAPGDSALAVVVAIPTAALGAVTAYLGGSEIRAVHPPARPAPAP